MSEHHATVRRIGPTFWEFRCSAGWCSSPWRFATWQAAMNYATDHVRPKGDQYAGLTAEKERPLVERAEGLTEAWEEAWLKVLRLSGEAATLKPGLPRAGLAPSPGAGEPTHTRERGTILHELTIGHLIFTVREDDDAIRAHNSRHQESVHGYTNMSTQEIVLATEDHEGHEIADGQRRTTLLHEVLHAALEVSGLERDAEAEERWIQAIQGPLLTALQDGWLVEELAAEHPGEPVEPAGRSVAWRDPAPRSGWPHSMVDSINEALHGPGAVERKGAARYDVRKGGDGRRNATGGSSCPN